MFKIKAVIEKIVKSVAEKGAGVASLGFAYEPKVPEKIKK